MDTIEEKVVSADAPAKKENEISDYFSNLDFSGVKVNLEAMLKSGVHFGHQKSRKNPKMEEYIFTTRKGVSIIDLERVADKVNEAMEFLKKIKSEGKQILFVTTKKQMSSLVKSAAKHCQMPFVVDRWLGGTFTNFKVIKGRTKYLKDSQGMMERGEFKKYTKFERMKKNEELEKLEKRMGGIKEMNELPAAIIVTDIKEDILAIREARKMNIPVVAISDTNVDPMLVDYPIPGNDDAISSVRLILSYLCKAITETNVVAKDVKVLK